MLQTRPAGSQTPLIRALLHALGAQVITFSRHHVCCDSCVLRTSSLQMCPPRPLYLAIGMRSYLAGSKATAPDVFCIKAKLGAADGCIRPGMYLDVLWPRVSLSWPEAILTGFLHEKGTGLAWPCLASRPLLCWECAGTQCKLLCCPCSLLPPWLRTFLSRKQSCWLLHRATGLFCSMLMAH